MDKYLENLNKYVKELGQRGTADKLGVSEGSVSNWLSGRHKPNNQDRLKLEDDRILTDYDIYNR